MKLNSLNIYKYLPNTNLINYDQSCDRLARIPIMYPNCLQSITMEEN